MKNRIITLALSAMLFAPSVSAEAQQPKKVPRSLSEKTHVDGVRKQEI